jgi:hypothetical protein
MKAFLCVVLVLGSIACAITQTVPASRAADTAAIKREIEVICQAFVDKDRNVLVETHGKDWRGFTPGNDHVIRGVDGYMDEATFSPGTKKGEGMVSYRLTDFDVVFYDDTAVASFVLDSEVVYNGRTTPQKLTILDVFHKDPRGWTQVASNTSLHGDEMLRQMSVAHGLSDADKQSLLETRMTVWHAWFAGDTATLAKLVPADLVVIDYSGAFKAQPTTLAESRSFAEGGGKLARLIFPRTEMQAYGATVILYSTFELDVFADGKTTTQNGAATEIFVRRPEGWINTGWQLAPIRQ